MSRLSSRVQVSQGGLELTCRGARHHARPSALPAARGEGHGSWTWAIKNREAPGINGHQTKAVEMAPFVVLHVRVLASRARSARASRASRASPARHLEHLPPFAIAHLPHLAVTPLKLAHLALSPVLPLKLVHLPPFAIAHLTQLSFAHLEHLSALAITELAITLSLAHLTLSPILPLKLTHLSLPLKLAHLLLAHLAITSPLVSLTRAWAEELPQHVIQEHGSGCVDRIQGHQGIGSLDWGRS